MVLPLVYPVVLISISRNVNKSLLLIIGFALGLFVDVFSNTGGAHAVACTVMAFVRPFFLSSIGPSDMGSEAIKPSVVNLGLKNYGGLAFFLLAIHHITFFFLEAFTFSNVLWTLTRILISLFFSWLLVMVFQFTFVPKSK